MTQHARGEFTIKSWVENPIQEDTPKITNAKVEKEYQGDILGIGQVEYLMVYLPDGRATIKGVEHFTGSVHGKSGRFVFEHEGSFENGVVKSTWKILPGSGQQELEKIEGKVIFEAGHLEKYPISLELTSI